MSDDTGGNVTGAQDSAEKGLIPRGERAQSVILNSIAELVIYLDRDKKIRWANQSAADWAGCAIDRLIGRKCVDFWRHRDDLCDSCPIDNTLKTGIHQQSDIAAIDGTFWSIRGNPVYDESGNIVGVVQIALDITERKHAEEKLVESKTKYKNLTEDLTDVVLRISATGILEYCSPVLKEFGGYNPEEEVGNHISKYFAKKRELVKTIRLFRRVLEEFKSVSFELLFRPEHGEPFYVEVSGKPILGDGGAVTIHCSMRDIGKRKEAEQVLIKRLSYEKALSECSQALLHAGSEMEEALLSTLRILLDVSQVDRVHLFENYDEPGKGLCFRQVNETDAGGVVSLKDNMLEQHFSYGDGLERWRETLKQLNTLEGPVDSFLAGEREFLEVLGASSILLLPIVDRKWYGFLCLADIGHIRHWNEEDVRMLMTMAEMLGSYIERRRSEDELRASEQRFRNIFALSSDAIITTDIQGRIIDCNTMACDMFQRDWEMMIKLSLDDIVSDAQLEIHESSLVQSLISWGNQVEALGKWEDGSAFPIDLNGVMLTEGDNQKVWIFIRDITDRKLQEQERMDLFERMQKAQRYESLGVLAGGMAHDFNNILAAILGNAELGQQELPENHPAYKTFGDIQLSAKRAADLNKQLLAYSGQGKYFVNRINISDEVEEIIELVGVSVPENIRLKKELSFVLPPVVADQAQFQQIVMNLISNAIEAINKDSEGVVCIRTGVTDIDKTYLDNMVGEEGIEPGRYVYYEVADNGCGMDTATKARAFEPFFTTNFIGRGLGLPAILGIARSHKGAVLLDSNVGKGTTVRALLPVKPSTELAFIAETYSDEKEKKTDRGKILSSELKGEKAEVVDQSEEVRQPDISATEKTIEPSQLFNTGECTVFVAEDEEAVLKPVVEMLNRGGFNVLTATDGEKAVTQFRENSQSITIVLLDYKMPKKNGVQVLREMREISPDVPVILMSGYTREEATCHFPDQALTGFIQKPYEMKSLLELIESTIQRS